MIDYTGHPLFDVGLATLTAFAQKHHPRELEEKDLKCAVDYMANNYVVNPLKSFLTVAFPNSGFTQPAYEKQPEKRRIYAQRVLQCNAPNTTEIDPFTGLNAAAVSYDVKGELLPGRAFRQHVPLLTGEDIINFHPYGDAGIPVSSLTMLAFQALPLGCAKVSGRLLAVHSDDPELLLYFARTFLVINRKNVQLAQVTDEKKLPDTSPYQARTLLIEHLLTAEKTLLHLKTDAAPPTLTAYYFSNSGQGVELEIIPLPLEVSAFLRAVTSPKYEQHWQALVARGWQLTQSADSSPRYNRLYEDLFSLPERAPQFIRLYFLRRPGRVKDRLDPTQNYETHREINLILWSLTELFLRKVMLMDDMRIQHICKLGDDLATHIIKQNDRSFFNAFWMARNYGELRAALIRASLLEVRRGHPPLITLDQFLAIFEQAEGIPNVDWRLGRDLVLIRLLEQLYQQGWLQQHAAELPESAEGDEA